MTCFSHVNRFHCLFSNDMNSVFSKPTKKTISSFKKPHIHIRGEVFLEAFIDIKQKLQKRLPSHRKQEKEIMATKSLYRQHSRDREQAGLQFVLEEKRLRM